MLNNHQKDMELLKSKVIKSNAIQDKPIIGILKSIENAQSRIISAIAKTNTGVQIIIIVIAIVFLVYGFGFRSYKIYDMPNAADNGMLSTFMKISQASLMEELSYDAIIKDTNGNMINKGREAHCLT
jgi:hypothetical protein